MNAQSEIKVKRGERLLNAVGNKTGLTPEAKAWLTASLDPFHDGQIPNLEGYPDTLTSPSVVQVVKKALNLSKPVGLASGNWDILVHFHDSLQVNLARPCGLNANMVKQDMANNSVSSPIMHSGGISIVARLSSDISNPLWMFSGDLTKGVAMNSPSTDPEFLKGRSRCIGRAFQVRNTTAEIYKQGSICVYRQPTAPEEFASYMMQINNSPLLEDESTTKKKKRVGVANPSTAFVGRDLRFSTPPPSNLGDALLLPGSRQWEAKHGCYVVQTQYDMENPASYFAPRGNLINLDETNLNFPSCSVTEGAQTLYTQVPNGIDFDTSILFSEGVDPVVLPAPTYNQQKYIPYNPCGCIISGLGDNSTLTLNWIEIFERTISSEQKDLVTLAKPSAPVNFQALELYSAVWRDLPVGVPVEENGLGEWFLGVCDSIAECISDIGRPILGAVAGFQNTRNAPQPIMNPSAPTNVNNTWTANDKPRAPKQKIQTGAGKVKITKKGKVKAVSGPQLPNGKFKGKNRDR